MNSKDDVKYITLPLSNNREISLKFVYNEDHNWTYIATTECLLDIQDILKVK